MKTNKTPSKLDFLVGCLISPFPAEIGIWDSPLNTSCQQAKDHYKACMDLEKLEEIGHSPLLKNLQLFGGWPVLDGDKWDESQFDWYVFTIQYSILH